MRRFFEHIIIFTIIIIIIFIREKISKVNLLLHILTGVCEILELPELSLSVLKVLLDFDVLLILKETFCNIWLSLSGLKLIFFDNIFTGCEPSEWIVGLFIKGVFTCLNWLFSLFEEVKKSSRKNPFFILFGAYTNFFIYY